MNPAASRLVILGAWALLAAGAAAADESSVRLAPSRPAPLVTVRFNGVDYVSATEVAIRLGLKGTWIEPGRRLVLGDGSPRIELGISGRAEGREVTVDGLHVFLGDQVVARDGKLYVSRTDFERRLLPLVRPALGGAPLPPPKIIALDPGHGLPDDGMQNGQLSLKERVLTLDVAVRLKKLLEGGGYQVVLTRTDDRALSAEKKIDFAMRDRIANRARADLFVSIHFNSLYPDKKTGGTEIYTFPPRGQHATEWPIQARRDDPDLDGADEPVNRFDGWSALLAQALHRSVLASLKTEDRGAKIMHLGVLRNLECPGVLVESVFLSNDTEAGRAATAEYRQQIAEAIAAGIRAYAATLDTLRPSGLKSPATAVSGPASIHQSSQ